jgi:hypothetical protein
MDLGGTLSTKQNSPKGLKNMLSSERIRTNAPYQPNKKENASVCMLYYACLIIFSNSLLRPTSAVHPKFTHKHCPALFYTIDCTVRRVEFEYGYKYE